MPPISRYEQLSRVPLTVMGLVFLAAYAWPILDTGISDRARSVCAVGGVLIWAAFVADFVIRLAVAGDRRAFLRHNWLDLIMIALPMLRPLQALRGIVGLRVVGRGGASFTRRRVVAATAVAVAAVAGVAALAMLDVERSSPDGNIRGYGDALWWAVSTITTVGYGDRYPTTGDGRMIAAALMISGIALLGVVTASIASWFVQRVREVEDSESQTRAAIERLSAEIQELREGLGRGRRAADAGRD